MARAIFVWQGSRGMQFPLAELRGGSSLSGCRVESPALGTGAKRPVRVKGETLPSEVNAMRHFVLGYYPTQNPDGSC